MASNQKVYKMMRNRKFLSVLGPSRSGTTVLAAIVDAHPQVKLAFEPFQSQTADAIPDSYQDLDNFESDMSTKYACTAAKVDVIGMKNTIGPTGASDWVKATLMNFEKDASIKMALIVRDPAETYLSNVDGDKKWWGNPDRKVSASDLIFHFELVAAALVEMKLLLEKYGGTLFSYKMLVTYPNVVLSAIMSSVGLEFQEAQLNYYKLNEHNKYWGDVGVNTNPQPLALEKYSQRREEAEIFMASISNQIDQVRIDQIRREIREIENEIVIIG